jgi:short-chain fatty acids transporter
MIVTRLAVALTRWSARYIPSAFSIACLLTAITVVLGMTLGEAKALDVVRAWGDGFWTLLRFGMQMCLIVLAGYVVAVAPPVRRALSFVAGLPRSDTGAVVAMAMISMTLAWVHWGLGLVAGAVTVGHVARQNPKADYRLLVAASYFGLGATWHAGLSGSVPLLLATSNNFLIKEGIIAQVVPVDETLLMPFNLIFTPLVMVVLSALAALLHPKQEDRVTIEATAAAKLTEHESPEKPDKLTPALWLEHSPLINLLMAGFGGVWLFQYFAKNGVLGGLNLNVINFVFLFGAILLHWRPVSLTKAAAEGSSHLHGIVLQFPLYAGMFGIIQGTALAKKIADAFVSVASTRTLPLITFWYSGILNYFVPSGGSKWAIEAPYLIDAARRRGVSVPRVAMAYAYGDMCTNLIQPFWAIPLLSVAKLEFKDILGFEAIAFIVYTAMASIALTYFY